MCSARSIKPVRYQPRQADKALLFQVVLEYLEEFLEQARIRGYELPVYVLKEFDDFLRCGVLSNGFLRVRCDDCGGSMVVGYSCKGRGFCPSCTGRRMADTSARLVDDVFPEGVPVRQWVLSLPMDIRYRLGYDGKLLTEVLRVYLRVLNGWYRKQGKLLGVKDPRWGVVTFAQHFGSSLNKNVHFHNMALDAIFNPNSGVFHDTPLLFDDDVKQIVETVADRVIALLERRGVRVDEEYDEFADEEPLLARISSASICGIIATGERVGQRVRIRRTTLDPAVGVKTSDLCFASRGFSLHAARRVEAGDKAGLERLCNYVSRPPLAAGSLIKVSEDKYYFKLKTPWNDGTRHLTFSPLEIIEKLAALVPPPRVNLVRYHGLLAPNSKLRSQVVPEKKDPEELEKTRGKSKNRLLWAALLARTLNCACFAMLVNPVVICRRRGLASTLLRHITTTGSN